MNPFRFRMNCTLSTIVCQKRKEKISSNTEGKQQKKHEEIVRDGKDAHKFLQLHGSHERFITLYKLSSIMFSLFMCKCEVYG